MQNMSSHLWYSPRPQAFMTNCLLIFVPIFLWYSSNKLRNKQWQVSNVRSSLSPETSICHNKRAGPENMARREDGLGGRKGGAVLGKGSCWMGWGEHKPLSRRGLVCIAPILSSTTHPFCRICRVGDDRTARRKNLQEREAESNPSNHPPHPSRNPSKAWRREDLIGILQALHLRSYPNSYPSSDRNPKWSSIARMNGGDTNSNKPEACLMFSTPPFLTSNPQLSKLDLSLLKSPSRGVWGELAPPTYLWAYAAEAYWPAAGFYLGWQCFVR